MADDRWEYCRISEIALELTSFTGAGGHVVRLPSPDRRRPWLGFEMAISQLGEQGWELVAATGNNGADHLYFKRRRQLA